MKKYHGISTATPLLADFPRSLHADSTNMKDVGFEKPCREIFDAARTSIDSNQEHEAQGPFIHVGDDPAKDFDGAVQAGWDGLLIDREGHYITQRVQKKVISNLLELNPYLPGSLSEQDDNGSERISI